MENTSYPNPYKNYRQSCIIDNLLYEEVKSMFLKLDWSLNQKSYRFMVQWLDRWSNRVELMTS